MFRNPVMDILIKNFIFIYHIRIKNGSVETVVQDLFCTLL
jgi:hypothetical protein